MKEKGDGEQVGKKEKERNEEGGRGSEMVQAPARTSPMG